MKAILEFETPESCAECPLKASYQRSSSSIRESWCVRYPEKTIEDFQQGRALFCPLKIISDDAPTVDAVPVKYAEWREYDGVDKGFHYCSNCTGQAFNYDDGDCIEVLSNYCPNCGCKMENIEGDKERP